MMPGNARISLGSQAAQAVVDVEQGCRLASLRVFGYELLRTHGLSSLEWGSW